jgi:hypothetical protein
MRNPSLLSALALFGLAGAVSTFGCNKAAPSAAADAQAAAPAPAVADAAAAAPPTLAFLNGFEGEIDGTVKEAKPNAQPMPISLFVKGDKFRIDLPEQLARNSGSPMGAPSYVVVDSGQKKLYMVLDAAKQVMFLDLNKAQDMMKSFGGRPGPAGHGDAGPPKVTKTGRFETVAGYRCEDWDVATEHRESTVCVANEGGSWFSIPFGSPSPETSWMAELLDGKHFPLRAIQYDKDGTTETSRLEVTKIEKKALPDDEFQFPAGYAQVDLGKMLQGIAGMASGMHAMPRPPMPMLDKK